MSNRIEKKYEVQNTSVGTMLSWIESGEIGLPELQRPFVWHTVKVRDFIDSLYHGFPVGYIITWNNPNVQLKDGQTATGKKIIIDGQQRLTALQAAIKGNKVSDSKFREFYIKIAFNPFTETFETLTAAIQKDKNWIPDISLLFRNDYDSYSFITDFSKLNNVNPTTVSNQINNLSRLINNDIGNIILSAQLPIDQVTEIFNRINSKGTELSSADFIMSKLAADTDHDGNNIRKSVEYFSQFLISPQSLDNVSKNDTEFLKTNYFHSIKWAANEQSNLYQPRFGDIFHVVLAFQFGRGKHSDLVSLISGRDFKTRTYTEDAMTEAYSQLSEGVESFVNKSHFKRYIMILHSLGMIDDGKLVLNGSGTLNFGYALFLLLSTQQNLNESRIERIVKKWIVMSALTTRYSGSSETQSERDIRAFINGNPEEVLETTIDQELSDSFWSVTLPQKLETSSTTNNAWRIFLMAQVHNNDTAWLEKDHTISSLLREQGNIHHIFPKAYLRKNGLNRADFNQIANYTWLTQPRNLAINDSAPAEYLHNQKITEYSNNDNFADNAIPDWVVNATINDYQRFLKERRHLMSQKIKLYFSQI